MEDLMMILMIMEKFEIYLQHNLSSRTVQSNWIL